MQSVIVLRSFLFHLQTTETDLNNEANGRPVLVSYI